MKVQKLTVLVIPAILLIGLVLLGISDTRIAIADTSVPDNEVTSSISKASNSSANATIIITMTGTLNE